MEFSTILFSSLCSALFAAGMVVILTAPRRYLLATFVCSFAGRFVRDLLMGSGISQNLSTVLATTVIVLVAVAVTSRHRISPVVLVCGVLPLGSAIAMFNVIFNLMKVSSLTGMELDAAVVALSANAGKVFAGSLAIALGLGAGLAIVRLFNSSGEAEGV